jgi:molybdopterin converting factor small subunit
VPTVYIPSLLRDLTGGNDRVIVPGATVGEVIASLDREYPGIKARLCEGESLRSGIALVVGSGVSRQGLRHPLTDGSEVHFLPAVSGG